MDWISTSFLASIFFFAVSGVFLLYLFWTESKFAEKRTIKKRLLYISAGGLHGQEKLLPYKENVLKNVGALERLAFQFPRISSLDRMILKSKYPLNVSTFVLISLAMGILGFIIGYKFLPQLVMAIILSALFLAIPYYILKINEKVYFNKFDEQLPEALDLLARAMRSGHALTSGLEMICDEMENPIKSEFSALVDEVNLGLTLKDAFNNLCERIPSTDLRFLAIAVVIQKETGGNLAEILDNISHLIRERMQFSRQVKTLTAEGKLSAVVLILLPILMFVYIYFMNYEYLSLLWTDKTGLIMLMTGIILQIIGSLIINKIVSIEL